MINRINNQKGVALALAMVLGILVSLTVLIALNATGHRIRMTAVDQHRGESFYADEAAIQIAFIKLGRNLPVGGTDPSDMAPDNRPYTENISIGDRTVTLTVRKTQANPDQFTVSSSTEI